ncbi:ExbD/TolR family protein [Candidatus Halocynthiibacter alkanivorans]|uniref:ExbD/TolR family protein n=1 Tax=Candidatus Halocynthiibacter alkanivorans TaxID=2267619 RepID=UPI000DF2D339|nr:biopolymer transporter ExbD [Candidatus Halocynthiibacter alkanivorans]
MELRRSRPQKTLISLVPMIDVMLILLVFFMVTSTYLDLDIIPTVEQSEERAPEDPAPPTAGAQAAVNTLLVRISPAGDPVIRGQSLSVAGLIARVEEAQTQQAGLQVLVLPSGQATLQALVSVVDALTRAGVQRLRVIRLEVAP